MPAVHCALSFVVFVLLRALRGLSCLTKPRRHTKKHKESGPSPPHGPGSEFVEWLCGRAELTQGSYNWCYGRAEEEALKHQARPRQRRIALRKPLILTLVCLFLLSTTANSQTRRRSAPRRSSSSAAAAEKMSAELQTGRRQVATQIKTLTQFLYLFGGVVKGFESVDQASGSEPPSPVAIQQYERSKAKVADSIRNIRDGLDKLETQIRFNSATSRYYPQLSGVGRLAEIAEEQASAKRFDEAGKSLLRIVNQLADTLAAMR